MEFFASLSFLERALIVAVLTAFYAGLIGTFVVAKRMSSVAGGISHAAFGGVGLGFALGINPMFGALCFAVAAALIITEIYLRRGEVLETLISALWSIGMSLGILFIALTPGYAPDLMGFLFGNILLVSPEYILITLLTLVAVLGLVYLRFPELQAVTFDEEYSTVIGLPVKRELMLLFVLIAISVVLLMKIVGVVLTIALLTLPAVIARRYTTSLKGMIFVATLLALGTSILGILLAYQASVQFNLNLPTGPCIILLTSVLYLGSLLSQADQR
ncbi:metal ABC transporter permease [bacterium]|nr:metal ABC transporter permease [bacterium]